MITFLIGIVLLIVGGAVYGKTELCESSEAAFFPEKNRIDISLLSITVNF